jgi:predicted ABC-type transport system involved in lysophospholipase L1 biosynthesis ATPase subunit
VLLAAERAGNLDEGTQDEIIDGLARLRRDRGLTMAIDSVVAARAQRGAAMRDGRVGITRPAHAGQHPPAGQPG